LALFAAMPQASTAAIHFPCIDSAACPTA